ncbi:hypothetical protein CTRI78_v010103 [Colletotrichum trifolii]|uniref:Uncharacterized protein n=1 Tax=Colletotrichum trifolii TaxID=5466 RepID=A0A4R8QZM9_COLTR|nr:hypothetical protein CTRI78_v010103 [Colletotrichum trifolii]
MKFSAILLFVASVAAVALDTEMSPHLSQPGRRGVDCGACARLNFCPGKPNNNVECERMAAARKERGYPSGGPAGESAYCRINALREGLRLDTT